MGKISRKPKVKQCTECGGDFIPGHLGQAQCSLKCAKAAKLRAPASVKDKTQKPLRRSVRKAKKKAKTVHQLIEKAAELLQKIRRLEEADENGYCKCVSTGEIRHYKEMQGGHWIPRGKTRTKLCSWNINPQTPGANHPLNTFAADQYAAWMSREWGQEFVDEALARAQEPIKYTRAEALEIILLLKEQLKELEDNQWN